MHNLVTVTGRAGGVSKGKTILAAGHHNREINVDKGWGNTIVRINGQFANKVGGRLGRLPSDNNVGSII